MGDDPSPLRHSVRRLNTAKSPTASASNGTTALVWLAADELDGVVRRLPACDSATQRWESVAFLVLALAGVVAIGFAVLLAL